MAKLTRKELRTFTDGVVRSWLTDALLGGTEGREAHQARSRHHELDPQDLRDMLWDEWDRRAPKYVVLEEGATEEMIERAMLAYRPYEELESWWWEYNGNRCSPEWVTTVMAEDAAMAAAHWYRDEWTGDKLLTLMANEGRGDGAAFWWLDGTYYFTLGFNDHAKQIIKATFERKS